MKEYIPSLNRQGQTSLTRFVIAQRLFEAGKIAQALEAIDRALLDNSEFADAHWFKGLLLKHLGKLTAATDSIELAIRLQPENPKAWYELAHIRKKNKDYQFALEAIEQAFEHAQENNLELQKYYLLKGKILARLELRKEAIQAYEAGLNDDPHATAIHLELGRLLLKTGATDEAVRHLELAANLSPEAPIMRILLGNLWRKEGELYKSALEYLSAQKLNPNSVTPYRKIGSLFLEHDLNNEALRFFRIASYMEPENINHFLKLVVVYIRMRRFPEAIDVLRRALKIEPGRPDLIELLGKLEAAQKQTATQPAKKQRNRSSQIKSARQA